MTRNQKIEAVRNAAWAAVNAAAGTWLLVGYTAWWDIVIGVMCYAVAATNAGRALDAMKDPE